jgi:hypothetical protein
MKKKKPSFALCRFCGNLRSLSAMPHYERGMASGYLVGVCRACHSLYFKSGGS